MPGPSRKNRLGMSATVVGIFLTPGANALEVGKCVTVGVNALAKRFPASNDEQLS